MVTEADECDSDPCQNGATCVDELAYYDCVCVDGYEGDHCEIGQPQKKLSNTN